MPFGGGQESDNVQFPRFFSECQPLCPITTHVVLSVPGVATMAFLPFSLVGIMGVALLQPTPGIPTKNQECTGKSGNVGSCRSTRGCLAILEWVAYFPERSGSTCGWPRTWKRRGPISAFFSDCVSGPCLPEGGPCHGGGCSQATANPSKK